MNDRTVEITLTVNMFTTLTVNMFTVSPTHGAYIHIDSVTNATAFRELGHIFGIALFYGNMGIQDTSCFRSDSGDYFSNTLNI